MGLRRELMEETALDGRLLVKLSSGMLVEVGAFDFTGEVKIIVVQGDGFSGKTKKGYKTFRSTQVRKVYDPESKCWLKVDGVNYNKLICRPTSEKTKEKGKGA